MSVQALVGLAAGCVVLTSLTLPAAADTTVQAELVEQNKSGAGGSVVLTATDDGDLRVDIRATGLVPGPHAQHIHGAVGGRHFHCPTLQQDADGDGWLTNEEATGEYGEVYLALTTSGDVSAQSGLALERMPVADRQGRLSYQRTIPASRVPDKLIDELTDVHVVQHGIDVNGNDEYDLDALGESTFATSLGVDGVPEEATNPASCGVVVGAGIGQPPRGGVETGTGGTTETGWAVEDDVAPLAVLAVLLGLVVQARRRTRPPVG